MAGASNARDPDLRTGPRTDEDAAPEHWQVQRNIHASIERRNRNALRWKTEAGGNTSFLTGTCCRHAGMGAPRLKQSDMVMPKRGWINRWPWLGTQTRPVSRWIPNVPARHRPRPGTAALAKADSAAAALGRPVPAHGWKKGRAMPRGGYQVGIEPDQKGRSRA